MKGARLNSKGYPVVERKPYLASQEEREARRYLSKSERVAGDGSEIGGTTLTRLKFEGSPLSRLADRKSIGTDELRAAEDIQMAYMAICGEVLLKGQSFEKRDRTNGLYEPHVIVDAVARYRRWANHWSGRKKLGDLTLSIVIDVVIDERPLRAVENDYGLKHGRAATVIGSALRDYLARAGWASREDASRWIVAAESNFRLRRVQAA